MFRIFILALMLLQPLQWAWANVHITADAAHTTRHDHIAKKVTASDALAENALSCSLLDNGSGSHSCHDNHAHHSVDLGLDIGAGLGVKPDLRAAAPRGFLPVAFLAFAPTIERPNWFATR